MNKLQYSQKYEYFRTSAGQDSPTTLCFPGYSLGMLSNSFNRERFDNDSHIKLVIGGGEIVYTVGITLFEGDTENTKMIGRVSALASCTKGSFKDDGVVLETLPLKMGDANSDDRNVRFLIRRHDGKIPRHLDKCLRLTAGLFNYLTDLGLQTRGSLKPIEMQKAFGIGLMSTAGLVRHFMSDPVYDYVTDIDNRIERKLYEFRDLFKVATRVKNGLQLEEFSGLEGTFMTGPDLEADELQAYQEKKLGISDLPKTERKLFIKLKRVLLRNASVQYRHWHIAKLGTNYSSGATDYVIRFGLEFDPGHDGALHIEHLYRYLMQKTDNHYLVWETGGNGYLGEVYAEILTNHEGLVRLMADLVLDNPTRMGTFAPNEPETVPANG